MLQAIEYPTLELALSQAYESLRQALLESHDTNARWTFSLYEGVNKLFRRLYFPVFKRDEKPILTEDTPAFRYLKSNNLAGKLCEAQFGLGASFALAYGYRRETKLPEEDHLRNVSLPIEEHLQSVRFDPYRCYFIIPKEVRWFGDSLINLSQKEKVIPTIASIRNYTFTDLVLT
ncbi:MAG: hypothetical protein AABX04_00010 [Nanoarchaeota archaeon]